MVWGTCLGRNEARKSSTCNVAHLENCEDLSAQLDSYTLTMVVKQQSVEVHTSIERLDEIVMRVKF